MGYSTEHIKIAIRLHNHHDERDVTDKAQFEYLKREIKDLLDAPEVTIVVDYQNLEPA